MAERRNRSQARLDWQVHESTARGVCQLAFFTLGLIPLLICVAISARQFFPSYQRARVKAWEQVLAAQLGGDVLVAAFEARSPDRFALHEVRLLHPETRASIGRVRTVEVERIGRNWSLRLNQPELDGKQLPMAWKMFHDWFLCRPSNEAGSIEVTMSELGIHGPSARRTLLDVTLKVLPASDATVANFQFFPAKLVTKASAVGVTAKEKLTKLTVKRLHGADKLGTDIQLRTGSAPLHCSLLAELHPGLGQLGSEANFAGDLNLELYNRGWRVSITNGLFQAIDIGQLAIAPEPVFSGSGSVAFEKLAFDQFGLQEALGRGEIRLGRMDEHVFHSLGKHFGFQLRDSNPVSSYGFERLEFAISFGQPYLHLWGRVFDQQGLLALRENWDQGLPLTRLQTAMADWSAQKSGATNLATVSSNNITQ